MNANGRAAQCASAPKGHPMKFGVVLFDDEKNPRGAWVSVNGGDTRRIEGLHELGTDTYWWSNMTYESFFKTTEAWRNPWLRHDAYLVVKPRDVLLEWGQDPASSPPDHTAAFCSKAFFRIMMLAFKIARECDERIRMSTLFTGNTLRADLRRLLPKAEYPTGEAAGIMKTGQAFAEFTRTGLRGVKGSKQVMLRRPRLSYALEMITTPVPKGPFEFLPRSQIRQMAADKVAWISNSERPCMVEVSVDSMNADVAPVYGFGNSTDKDRRIPRSWVAHPEFLVMSSFSSMDVKNAWIGKEYSMMNLELMEPVRRFLADRYSDSSWTAGIIAETLWRAAALSEEKGRGPKVDPQDQAHISWRGAWVKASDKTSGFLSAMRLHELGYPAVSYGYGWVYCQVTEDQIPDLIRDGLTVGMVPRLSDVPESLFGLNRVVPWSGDKKSQLVAQLTLTKRKHTLWNLDLLPLLEKDKQSTRYKEILDAYKKQSIL